MWGGGSPISLQARARIKGTRLPPPPPPPFFCTLPPKRTDPHPVPGLLLLCLEVQGDMGLGGKEIPAKTLILFFKN